MTIEAFNTITPRIAKSAFISPMAFVNGDTHIGEDSSVWPGVVIRGDMAAIRIGERTSVQDGSVLHTTHASDTNPLGSTIGHPLTIGHQVTIGHMVCLHGCTIGNQVLIGIGAIILDGVVVEDQVVIAAGSLVTPGKRLKSGYMYMGSPAKQARPLTQAELDFFTYTTDHYVKTKNAYLNPIE